MMEDIEMEDIELMLDKYFSGELDYPEIKEVEKWISESQENRELAKEICRTRQYSNLYAISRTVSDDKILEQARKIVKKGRPSVSHIYVAMASVAAVLVAAVILTFGHRKSSENLLEVSTGPGMVSSVLLPDSSKVWLNSNSTLRYPAKFKGDSRQTFLEGEAFFEVKKNPEKPFLVNAGPSVIKVLGTKFDVEAYPGNGRLIKTTLQSGCVQMIFKENGDERVATLDPGQRLIFNPITGHSEISQVDTESLTSWKTGSLFFNSNSIDDVLSMIGNFYNVDFAVDESISFNEDTFSGSFAGQSLDEVLKIIGNVCSVKFKYASSEEGASKKIIVF